MAARKSRYRRRRRAGRLKGWPAVVSHPVRRAFTIVELLVVIAAIGLLVGLLFPALRSVAASGRQTVELNAARHLMAGYANYAGVHNDAVLPGHADWVPYRDAHHLSRRLPVYDKAGKEITGGQLDTARKRYLWRLAPFMSYNLRGLYLNENQDQLDHIEQSDYTTYLYLASLWPSLGLNTEWLGGDSGSDAYGFLPPDHNLRSFFDFDRYYITSLAQVKKPDTLLAFASARGKDPSSPDAQAVEGYYKVQSPYFSAATGTRWSATFNVTDEPVDYGYISPRHGGGGSACIGFADGHAGLLTKEQLKDMRHWANWATAADWRLPLLQN
jgi:prepilin-type N-terminal cleavage/methylation domain-containing protein